MTVDGMAKLIDQTIKQEWPNTIDASIWADVWLRTLSEHPDICTDKASMIGWFANAIMAGYDTAMIRTDPAPTQDKAMNVKIQIELDSRVIELTVEEAKALHQELSLMFGQKESVIPGTYPYIQPYQPTGPTWIATPYCPGSDQQCSTS